MRTAKRTGIAALFAVFFALLLAGCLCLGLPAKREAQAAEGAVSEEEITYNDETLDGISTPAELMDAYKKVVAGQATEITLAGNIQLDMVNDDTITGGDPNGHLGLPKSVTFDLNGNTLNIITGGGFCINIGQTVEGTDKTNATVTIKDGTLIGQSSGHFAIVQAGSTLNLSNVDVQFEKDKGDGQTTRPAAVAVNGRISDVDAAILNVNNVMFSKLENAVPVFVGDPPSDQGTVNFTSDDPLINLRDQINASSEYHKVETELTGNIDGSLVVPEYANITLDLNGYTITNTADKDTITNYGTLTVKDSSENDVGTVTNAGGSKAAIRNYGTAQLRGGTYTRTVAEGATTSYYVIKNVGCMMIGSSTESGVKVTASDEYSSLIANGYYGDADKKAHVDKITVDNACTMIIYDGTFTGGMNVVKNDNEGVLTIHDGEFSTTCNESVLLNANSLTICGGTFDASEARFAIRNQTGSLKIEKGDFKGEIYAPSQDVEITGGTFDRTFVSSYLAENASFYKQGGAFVVASEKPADAELIVAGLGAGNAAFTTLQAAIDAYKEGIADGTYNENYSISLYSDVTESVTVPVCTDSKGKVYPVSMNMYGHTLTAKDGSAAITVNGTFTWAIEGIGTIVGTWGIVVDGGTLEVNKDVVFNCTTDITVMNGGAVTVSAGTFNGTTANFDVQNGTVTLMGGTYSHAIPQSVTLAENYYQIEQDGKYVVAQAIVMIEYTKDAQEVAEGAMEWKGALDRINELSKEGISAFAVTLLQRVGAAGNTATREETLTIPEGVSLTLDFNGQTANFNIEIENNGSLILEGTENNGYYGKLTNSGELLILGGYYRDTYEGAIENNGGTIKVRGGSFGGKEMGAYARNIAQFLDDGYCFTGIGTGSTAYAKVGEAEATASVQDGEGTYYFSTLSNASAYACYHAESESVTIKLLQDVEHGALTLGSASDVKELTLDLGGHTLTYTRFFSGSSYQSSSAIVFGRNGGADEKITVTNGKIVTDKSFDNEKEDRSCFFIVKNNATLILDNVTVSYNGSSAPQNMVYVNQGTLNIKGGEYYGSIGVKDGANAEISGGTFTVKPEEGYLAEGMAVYEVDGKYLVGDQNAVAVVKETGTAYTSLQDAIDAAGEGATVTLLKNVTESVTIEKGKNITLDLNGQTLTNAEGSHTITNYGTLTVMDSGENGTVDNVSHGRSAVFNEAGATAYLNNGTFTRSAEASTGFNNNGGNSYYVILNQGTMTIGTEAGTPEIRFPEGKGYYSSLVENGWYTASQNTNGATAKLTVFNGTFVGGKHSLKNDSYGELVIGNANVSGAGSCAILNWNDLTVNGGTFSGGEGAIYSAASSNDYEQGKSVITGGSFSGTLILDGAASYSISDGEFDTVFPSAYLAENAVLVKTADGFKALDADSEAAKDYVAEVSDPDAETAVRYETLADAITAAKDGDTVKLCANVTLTEALTIDKSVTIDLNDKTLTSTNSTSNNFNIEGGTAEDVKISVKIMNGSIVGAFTALNVKNYVELTLEGVELTTALNYGIQLRGDGEQTVNLINSTVTGAAAGVVLFTHIAPTELTVSLYAENSTITGTDGFGISGNGNPGKATTDIQLVNSTVTSNTGTAIYHPQDGTLVVDGGKVTGLNAGIEMRSGSLTVKGGAEITATATEFSIKENGNGTTIIGAAIGVSQHSTNLAINVDLQDGTYNGVYAFYEEDIQDPETGAEVALSIKGGAYNGKVESKTVTGFIEGGDFGVKPADKLMNEGYAAEYVNGRYVAVPSTALQEARLAAQADVRAYAATMGVVWSDIVAEAADESAAKAQLVLAAYNAIAEAMSTLAVAEAKAEAFVAVDDYADAIEEAFAKLVADAIAEIKNEAAASEDRTAVVVPTATYAAIYAAETEAELTYLKDNALAEIKDIRAYRGEIAAQTEELETLAAAIAAIDDGLFGTDEGAQGAIEAIQDAIKAAQEAITGGDETTSTSLKEIYDYLEGTLKGAVDGIREMLTDAVSKGGILYEMQATLEALDATVNGDGAEGPALLDQLTAAIEAAQNAINGNTAEGLDGAVEKITAAITAAQKVIIAALPDYEETLGEIAGSVDKLEELLGGTNGLVAIKKGIDDALAAIGTADGETLFEQLAAIESGNTAIKTTVDELAAALTGTDGAIATLTAALTAMQGDITELTGALAEDTGWVAKDIAAAQAEINKLTAAVGKLGTVDGKDLAAVVGEIADGLEEMDATVNSIASTVSAASAVEEAKTQAAADIRTWLEGYLEELAGDTAQADVLARAAYTAETTEGELYKDISAQFGEENGKLVLKYYNEALAAIDAATTVSDVTTAVATFRAQVASIEASAGNSTDLTVVYVLLGVVLLVLIIACIVALVKGGRQPEPAPAQAAPAEAKPAEAQPEEKAEEKEEQAEEAAPAEEPAGEMAPAEEESAAAEDDDKERVVISANVRTFDEAYEDLTDEQRELFNKVKEYALAKEDAVEVKQSGGVVIKRKSKQIVKLTVRRDMPVALFLLENEMLKDFRRNAKSEAKLKVRATELVIREADDLETAYTMVDLSVEQIEKDLEAAKERRREARRQRRLQRQAEEAAAEQAEGAGEPAPAEEPASAESAATDGTDAE